MRIQLDVTNMSVRKGDKVTPANLGRIAAKRLSGDASGTGFRGRDRVSAMPDLLLQRQSQPADVAVLPEPRLTLTDLGIQLADGPTAGRDGFFSVSREMITAGQFRQFMEKTGHGRGRLIVDEKKLSSVELIKGCAYDDVLAFCQWVSQETGRKCCLPTAEDLESVSSQAVMRKITSLLELSTATDEQLDIYELTSAIVKNDGKENVLLVSLKKEELFWPKVKKAFPSNTGFRLLIFTPYS